MHRGHIKHMTCVQSDSMPFELQVAQLIEMGFEDSTASVAALQKVLYTNLMLTSC